jgi:hypothetical protein
MSQVATTRKASRPGAPSANHGVVENDQDDGSDEGHEKTGGFAFLVEAERMSGDACDERTGNAKGHGDDPPARLFAGDDHARERADDEPEDEKQKEVHGARALHEAYPFGQARSSCPSGARRASALNKQCGIPAPGWELPASGGTPPPLKAQA